MQTIGNCRAVEDSLPNHWINWCRLCAKEDKNNINFFYQNDEHSKDESKKFVIQGALEKYFCVHPTLEDPFPKMLCTSCLSLVSSMVNFNERVERVQHMFSHLAGNQIYSNYIDLNDVRLKFDITESESDRWFNKTPFKEFDGMCNKHTAINNCRESAIESKIEVQIKQEDAEKLLALECEKYVNQDIELDKEDMVFDENLNDSCPEDEDPFQSNEKDKLSSEEGENEKSQPVLSNKTEAHMHKSKLDRSQKKKRKRKKFKQFSNNDCNQRKKSYIKDIKMESSCKECGKIFSKYISYREHMQQEHNHSDSEKHWPCPACDKVLLSIYNLERHVRVHVPLEVRQTIKCPDCDNRYTSNAQLETHVRYKHKNEKPFICEECGLCLRTNSNLRQHMLIHTDVAPFECEVCKKKFKNKTRLKTHMDIHSPNKHVCNICGLQLNSRATLNRHFLVHSDEMQHKCDYCGKAFKRAKALKNHLLLHTGLKPYSCDFCERTFANGSNCRSHMKKIHPEELAVLEASGNKTHTKNIPKLETLKAVTKAADNLTPVVTKFSGCFAFGKKPKNTETSDSKQTQQPKQKLKKPTSLQNDNEKIVCISPSSAPLDLQYIPLVGNTAAPACLPEVKNLEDDLSTTALATTTPIPNFDNIYQHLLKQNQTDLEIKPPLSQISLQPTASNVSTPQHNAFYHDIINHAIKPALQPNDDLLHSPESHQGTMTPLLNDDQSNSSSIHGTFYAPLRATLPPGSFM